MPPDMMKPAANQAFGSKWKKIKKNTKSYFRKTAFIFGDKKIPPKKSWRQITFCRKRRFHHIWQQITETPSDSTTARAAPERVIFLFVLGFCSHLYKKLSSGRASRSLHQLWARRGVLRKALRLDRSSKLRIRSHIRPSSSPVRACMVPSLLLPRHTHSTLQLSGSVVVCDRFLERTKLSRSGAPTGECPL